MPSSDVSKDGMSLANIELTPELFKLMKMLPPKYDVRKIPEEVVQSISKGEVPDFDLLPKDLQDHLMANFQEFLNNFMKVCLWLDFCLHFQVGSFLFFF